MIDIQDIHKSFGTQRALQGLSLTVAPGEVCGLLGPNGAGKTTTISLLLGFGQPDQGQLLVDGVDVSQAPAQARQRIAYIPEQVMLYPRLTGLENLSYFHTLSPAPPLDDAQLRHCLSAAGLTEEAHQRRVSGYSKGMRQKVGIAIALARKTPVLLLDEPTSGLDPQAAREFGLRLRSLADTGVAVLMATHDLFRAREVADDICILAHGRSVARLSANDLGSSELEAVYLERVQDA